jgi:hypothetical protein
MRASGRARRVRASRSDDASMTSSAPMTTAAAAMSVNRPPRLATEEQSERPRNRHGSHSVILDMMLTGGRVVGACVVGAALLVAGCSSGGGKQSTPTTVSATTSAGEEMPTTKDRTAASTPKSVDGLTAEQLDAHLGVGVPKGWYPVDLGDARIWVPANMTVETEGGATECGDFGQPPLPVNGLLALGFSTPLCPRHPKFKARQTGALVLSSASLAGTSYRTISGYRVYRVTSTTGPTSGAYDVPQLGVQIALHGTLADRILNTLSPSSRKVAMTFASHPVPSGYRTGTSYGVSVSTPPQWVVTRPGAYFFGCNWPKSPSGAPEFVSVDPRNNGGPGCAVIDYSSILPTDGLLLYATSHFSPPRREQPMAVMHHGTTNITVYAGTSAMTNVSTFSPSKLYLDTVDVFVHNTGSNIMHVLTLGLGRDGRVAGGVLASLQATA